ncbi:hypothetical protein [Streptomyces sp. HUAS ZL42]|uniref:hypothetical protein n=1 Tax=Streptomyces sp. HUAS ZL42 TaxID=3231715 RepID=UPI00345E20DA
MSTGVIIALIVIVAVVVAVAAVLTLRAQRGAGGTRGLKRRFGPEYDRTVARHDGDTKAAERELTTLVERHGGLRERPLEPAERERFEARWTAAQERFVDSPKEAVEEADRLLAELAGARGFPDGGHYEEQLAALTVHHAPHVGGYRHVHRVAHARVNGADDDRGPGTEDMRAAMVEARALFDDLVRPVREDTGRTRPRTRRKDDIETPARTETRSHLPWAIHRHHPKEG